MKEEYLNNPTRENYDRVTKFQNEIDWPFKANQEQLDYWNNINRTTERCPKCNGKLEYDDNSKQCHKCEMLWPISFEF
jgi:DnaJ-class molecular chaperone